MKSELDKIQYSNQSPTCACKVSLDYLGDKWILIIIRDLFRYHFTFTHFLKESKEKIATNILSDRLKKLQKLQIWSVKNVSFTLPKKTKEWIDLIKSTDKESVIKAKKNNYKEFRKKMFSC